MPLFAIIRLKGVFRLRSISLSWDYFHIVAGLSFSVSYTLGARLLNRGVFRGVIFKWRLFSAATFINMIFRTMGLAEYECFINHTWTVSWFVHSDQRSFLRQIDKWGLLICVFKFSAKFLVLTFPVNIPFKNNVLIIILLVVLSRDVQQGLSTWVLGRDSDDWSWKWWSWKKNYKIWLVIAALWATPWTLIV